MPSLQLTSSIHSGNEGDKEQDPKYTVTSSEVDVAAQVATGNDFTLDPTEAECVRYG